MFVSFNKVFNQKPQSQMEIPKAMLDHMNKNLPDGVKYIPTKDGRCTITSDGKSITLSGIVFKPTAEQKKILGKEFTYEDLMNYSYNAQKPLPLELEKDGYITLNGKEIPIEQMSYNPLLPVKYVSGSLFAYPKKFPEPFDLMLGDGTYSRTLSVSRVPNDSVNVAVFQSKNEEPLMIKYSVDEKNQKLNMNMTFNLKYAKSIRDIVESTMIYNAYLSGKAFLSGVPLDISAVDSNSTKFDVKSAVFWEKVLEIEDLLGVNFIPPMKDVQSEDIILVEELYQNLINHIPVRDTQKLTSIDGKWDFNNANRDILDSIGSVIFFSFHSVVDIELFGVDFSLPVLTGVCNAKIKEIITKDEKAKLVLEDESEEKKQYMCTMFFLTEEDMNAYESIGINEMVKVFKIAKTVNELLS